MKRTLIAMITGLALVAGGSLARAQIDENATPKAPYLAAVPDYAHWTVTLKYAATAFDSAAKADKPQPPPAGYPTIIDTIKTGDLRSVVLTFPDGASKQFTCQGDWVLASTPNGPQLSIATAMERPYVYYTKGFVLLDGVTINPSTYRDAPIHNGAQTFHYKSGDEDVWIDIDSMLPLAASKGGVEVSYKYLPAPPRPFIIPKDQAALLLKEQAAFQSTRSLR